MQLFRFDTRYEERLTAMQLTDLAVALSRTEGLGVTFEPVSVWRPAKKELSVSTFFESALTHQNIAAQQADIYLRALGNRVWTDYHAVRELHRWSQASPYPIFVRQLFCAAEDLRLTRKIVAVRPGTKGAVAVRAQGYGTWLQSNRRRRFREGQWLDLLFDTFYHQLYQLSSIAVVDDAVMEAMSEMKITEDWPDKVVQIIMCSETTTDLLGIFTSDVFQPFLRARDGVKDMAVQPFAMDFDAQSVEFAASDTAQSERKPAKSESMDPTRSVEDDRREEIEVWHQHQESDAPGMLLMNLHDSNTSPTVGEGARLGGDEIDSLVVRRGKSGGGQNREDEGEEDDKTSVEVGTNEHSERGPMLTTKEEKRKPLTIESQKRVRGWQEETFLVKRKLLRVFDEVMMHRMQSKAEGKRHGRLSKRLTKAAFDEDARMFYRKSPDERRFDVAVQILVDCSGSMFERLELAKPYLYLLHEVMKNRQIVHDICGFWEDVEQGSLQAATQLVTKFLHVIPFDECLKSNMAGYIDGLEPQLDNRDGYAIREIGRHLQARPERQKWLWVISDGDPAADNYRDALVDTKNAIRALRRVGIHVIHLCVVESSEFVDVESLQKLYGGGSIIVPASDQLPKVMEQTMQMIIKETTK